MKIGIGVTTYNRPECLAKWIEQIDKTTSQENTLTYIAADTDEDRKGIAARKNECLRALKDCDYVFLFDDDCYPIKAGWINFFVNSGYEHLLYCTRLRHKKRNKIGDLLIFEDCGGVFMFMKKSAIDRVGAFNERFGLYGFEHADYSNRILNSKLYPTLVDTDKYIYAADYANPNHKSSITLQDKATAIYLGGKLYHSDDLEKYIPL